MIKSLVDPENANVITPITEVNAERKRLLPNDMLIWCEKLNKDKMLFVVCDYKRVRLTATDFDDAVNCAKALSGALIHYERAITRADKAFTILESNVKAMSDILLSLKNQKAVTEAKQRRDNLKPMLNHRLIKKILDEIQKSPTIEEQIKLAEAKDIDVLMNIFLK